MVRESTRKAIAKYDKENCIVITIKLNKKTDSDILEAFKATDNRQGFIKQAIREKIARSVPVSDPSKEEFKDPFSDTISAALNTLSNKAKSILATTGKEGDK